MSLFMAVCGPFPLRALGALALLITIAATGSPLAKAQDLPPQPTETSTPSGLSTPVADSVAYAWGDDAFGKLGDNSTIDSDQPQPVPVPGHITVVEVAVGWNHSLALLSNGRVLAWGDDGFGQLGNGATTGSKPLPILVPGLTSVTDIAAGWRFSLAVRSDGSVRVWGGETQGELGDGGAFNDSRPSPVVVAGLTGIVQVAGGREFALARTSTGAVHVWGDDGAGQLGNGGGLAQDAASPIPVAGLANVTNIAAGMSHALVVSGGTVMTWGRDAEDQVGDGAADNGAIQTTPTGVLTNAVQVSRGRWTLARPARQRHSLGLGRRYQRAGGRRRHRHGPAQSCACKRPWSGRQPGRGPGQRGRPLLHSPDGQRHCQGLGGDAFGQLGDGGTNLDQGAPVNVLRLDSVSTLSAGRFHSLAVALSCRFTPVTILGTAGNDTLNGTAGINVIAGAAGNDVIRGNAANDILCGNLGKDTLDGGPDRDIADGGPGSDTLTLPGTTGRNVNLVTGQVSGETPARDLFSIENVRGSEAADVIRANAAVNRLDGLGGNDDLFGFEANDRLEGGNGNDDMDGRTRH